MAPDTMKRLIELASRSDLKAFEDAWNEAVANQTLSAQNYLDVITTLESQGQFQKAAANTLLLVNPYLERSKWDDALLVLKRIAKIAPKSSGLRTNLLRVFRGKYSANPTIEALIKHSGLDLGQDIEKAVVLLETYLAFSVGGYVEHRSGWGVGVVTAVDLDTAIVTIDFREMKGHQLTLDVAHAITKPLKSEHFRAMKFDRIDELRRIADEDPVRLVKIGVLSRERATTVRDLRDMFTDGVVPPKDWSKWWTKARTKVKRDQNIKLSTGNNPTVEVTVREQTFEETAVAHMSRLADLPAKVRFLRDLLTELDAHPETRPAIMMCAGVLAKTTTEGVDANPGAALSLAVILEKVTQIDRSYIIPEHLLLDKLIVDPDKVVERLPMVPVTADRKEILSRLSKLYPDRWPDLCVKAIYLGENDVGDYCLKDLVAAGAFDRATQIIFDVLKRFREHRSAFMWYVRVAIGDKLHAALPNPGKVSLLEKTIILHGFVKNRFFQTEDNDDAKDDVRKEFRDIEKMIQKGSYEFVRETLRDCKASEASNFYNLVRNTRSLPDDVKDGMLAAILRTRPEVAKERIEAEESAAGGEFVVDDRIIYVSRAGYLRYEAEFNKLVNDEIPRNAREIGRAASFGDLSENAEWTAALEKQGILSRRAEEMRAAIEKARILDESMITDGVIAVGSAVTLKNLSTQSNESYTILGPWDADMEKGIISYLAPLGRALLGKKVGGEAHVELPSGKIVYRVESIAPAHIVS